MILPPAIALVTSLPLTSACVIADVGAGTGALLDVIGAASPAAQVVGLDQSRFFRRRNDDRRGNERGPGRAGGAAEADTRHAVEQALATARGQLRVDIG